MGNLKREIFAYRGCGPGGIGNDVTGIPEEYFTGWLELELETSNTADFKLRWKRNNVYVFHRTLFLQRGSRHKHSANGM